MSRHDVDTGPRAPQDPIARALALLTGGFAAFLLLGFPQVTALSDGSPDPWAALLLVVAMVTGAVSGLGWVPGVRAARVLLSPEACLTALTLATLRVAVH